MDSLLHFLEQYPYPGLILFMILCGLGLPVPEEITLAFAGYISYAGKADVWWAAVACGIGILAGDLLPFTLGRLFGPRILRIRAVRAFVTRRRLSSFDKWFQRQGYKALIAARFLPGMRTAAFFTAGALKLSLFRFMLIDGLGILVVTPTFVFLGYHFGSEIDQLIKFIGRAERAVLWTGVAAVALLFVLWQVRARRRGLAQKQKEPTETYVEPSIPAGARGPTDPEPPAMDATEPALPPPAPDQQRPTSDGEAGSANSSRSGY